MNLQEYLISLNPKESAILIYGSEYELWRDGEYIGTAFWTKDENVGDSFQTRTSIEDGNFRVNVFVADRWELIINK